MSFGRTRVTLRVAEPYAHKAGAAFVFHEAVTVR